MRIETIQQIKDLALPMVPNDQQVVNAFVVAREMGKRYAVVEGFLGWWSRLNSEDESEKKAMAQYAFIPRYQRERGYNFNPVFDKLAYPGIQDIAKTRNYGGLKVDPNRFPAVVLYLADKAVFTEKEEAEAYCNELNTHAHEI